MGKALGNAGFPATTMGARDLFGGQLRLKIHIPSHTWQIVKAPQANFMGQMFAEPPYGYAPPQLAKGVRKSSFSFSREDLSGLSPRRYLSEKRVAVRPYTAEA